MGNELGPSLGSKFYEISDFEQKMPIKSYYTAYNLAILKFVKNAENQES